MKNIAEFSILGRVGKIKEFDGKTNVTICANYPYKDKDGAKKDSPHWNEISIFAEATRGYIKKFCNSGDLVMARGRLKQNSFQRDGETVYTVDMNCDDFSILAQKTATPADEPSATEKTKAKRK